MDKRSWLWRRKSSEKSPTGEADSSGGSLSSHSERYSDDQALSYHNAQSPEVTSKASQEEPNDSVKALSEKLSEALVNIRAKEDLVKQHAKVAEEAVSGWEKAETEVVALKKQVDTLTQRNLVLEERISHLDGALKECLRQLRQAREEQEQKICDAVTEQSSEWESSKSELESQLQTARVEASATVSGLHTKLEAAERENSTLVFQLHSVSEELKLRICERDLSTNAAETASKQHLDGIKKVARLEAECRRLKAVARRAAANEHRSGTASSIHVESFTDSQSDSGERLSVIENESFRMSGVVGRANDAGEPTNSDSSWASSSMAELDQFNKGKPLGNNNLMAPSVQINLMDDFLEMERLVALPEMPPPAPDTGTRVGELPLKAELEAMINRMCELEEKLDTLEGEKTKLERSLGECETQLKTSTAQLKEAEVKIEDLKAALLLATKAREAAEAEAEAAIVKIEELMERVEEKETNLTELQSQLAIVGEAKQMAEVELESACTKRNIAESRVVAIEREMQALRSKVGSYEDEVQKERANSDEALAKCQKLEHEISGMKLQKASNIGKLKVDQEKELAVAAHRFAECQKTIASLNQQLNSLAAVEDFLI